MEFNWNHSVYCFPSDIPPQATCVHQLCGAMLGYAVSGYAALQHTSGKGSGFSVQELEKLPCCGRLEKLILFNLFKKIKYMDRLYSLYNFFSIQFPKVSRERSRNEMCVLNHLDSWNMVVDSCSLSEIFKLSWDIFCKSLYLPAQSWVIGLMWKYWG